MIFGLDHLGLSRYPKVAASVHPKGWALGFFSQKNLFGVDPLPGLKKWFFDAGKFPPIIRVQLCWSDDHRYQNKFEQIRKEARRVAKFAALYPQIEWRFSGACEHLLTKKQATQLKELVLAEAPFVTYVNTPMTGGAYIEVGEKVLNETHGEAGKKNRYQFSFDGANCVNKNVTLFKRNHASAEVFFLWAIRFNGKWNEKDTTSRLLRKGWPDRDYIKSVIALADDRGRTKLPRAWTYKSHAENHGAKDFKGEKPLFIAPVKTDRIVIQTKNSTVVFKYFGPYAGGGWRYYHLECMGFEIAKTLGVSSSELAEIKVGEKVIGKLNPSFRDGKYR